MTLFRREVLALIFYLLEILIAVVFIIPIFLLVILAFHFGEGDKAAGVMREWTSPNNY